MYCLYHGILPRVWIFWTAILVHILLKCNIHISSYFTAKVENMHVDDNHVPCPTIEMQLFPQAKAI